MMSLADGFGEHNLEDVVNVLVQVVEAAGAAIIFAGAVIAFVRFLLAAFRREGMDPFAKLRLDLGRFLVLGLEFQLAADILRTAVAPNFTERRRWRPSGRRSTSSSDSRSRRKPSSSEPIRPPPRRPPPPRPRQPPRHRDHHR
jgi:uncharacterized membrane protein